MNRRRFLKLVGASALTYPFLRGVPGYAAGSNGGTDPVYLVLLFTANGCVRYLWGAQGPIPTSQAPTATAVTNGPLQFRPTLSAFTKAGPSQVDLSKYVTILDGLQNKAAQGGTHETGMATLWTGINGMDGTTPNGPSIDQVIASQLNASTPYKSIAMVVQSSADFYQSRTVDNRMIYDLTGNWVDPIASTPLDTVNKLFPMPVATMTGPDKKTFIRTQVANHVNADLTRLQARLCTDDRIQLQNLQALWNTVLSQLAAAASQAAMCSRPTVTGGDAGSASADPFPTYAAIMPNVLAMTLACNLTQVASLQYSQALSPVTHTWLGPNQNQTHHSFSHTGPSVIQQLFNLPMASNDIYAESPAVASSSGYTSIGQNYPQQLIDIDAWYAQQIAGLAYTFSQVASGSNGKTLLDQSVTCWGSEIDMGNSHNHDDTPFVLIGGAGGQIKAPTVGGQLVRFPLNLTQSSGYPNNNACGLRFHNDLLVTLAQIMGVTTAQLQTGYGSSWSSFNGLVQEPISDILT
ncbi:MAG TPA: DUF1552 domain-containing protein [Polyangiaceae bacterium]